MRKIGEKYTYLWTIFIGIPFGIGMLIAAFAQFKEIPKTELKAFTGVITEWGDTYILDGKDRDRLPVLFVYFYNKKFYSAIGREKIF